MTSNDGKGSSRSVQFLPEPDVKMKVASSIQDAEDNISHAETDPAAQLATGVCNAYLPHMQKLQKSMDELVKNQQTVTETLEHENQRFCESLQQFEVQEMIYKLKFYHSKLVNIKKEMATQNDRSFKLKKRAEKLQQQKQKEALQREINREREEERERHLVAQLAKKS